MPSVMTGEIERLVATIGDGPVLIVGHTDDTPIEIGNDRLAELRAEAVAKVFIAEGIASDRITTLGRGDSEPIADNGQASGRAKNRRIEIFVAC